MVRLHKRNLVKNEIFHKPVLLREILENIQVEKGFWYIDATLGDGGHSLAILKKGGKVLGVDVDPKALERAKRRFKAEGITEDKFKLVQGNFRDLNNLLQTEMDSQVRAILFDLGVSSLQIDSPNRGFSFLKNGPLDMRMDPTLAVTAADLLKVLKKGELNELFSKLGEEKRAWAMASAVERSGEIKTTGQLASLAEKVSGRRKEGEIHPATRIFQALRMAVNDELGALEEVLPQALEVVAGGGKVLVISFHSLEDRIVKTTFKKWEDQDQGLVITEKPILPTESEVMENPRSRSAKLRVFKKRL